VKLLLGPPIEEEAQPKTQINWGPKPKSPCYWVRTVTAPLHTQNAWRSREI